MITDSCNKRQKALDVAHEKFSKYVRGVENYVTPDGKAKVTLPSGYSNVWTNGNGEYILTNNSLFNPNQQFSGTWLQAKKASQVRDSESPP
jgi:hypothetical protein